MRDMPGRSASHNQPYPYALQQPELRWPLLHVK